MLDLAIFFFQGLICTLPPELKKIIYNDYITSICRNKNLIHEELQVFNSINTHHISYTSTIMKDLYYLFPERFTFEMKSDYYDLVFMWRFKKYCTCNLCLIITTSKRELRSLGRAVEMFMRNIARSHLQSVFFR